MSEFEITALVLSEHEVFRREFAALEDADDLAAAWEALAARLEVHAVAEEELFYPRLAQETSATAEDGEAAVHDHNEIRHAAAAVSEHAVGDDTWWAAVRAAQEGNADHMAEEERDVQPPFKAGLGEDEREELGMRWLQFHDEHDGARGLSGEDADPEAVVRGEGHAEVETA